MPQDIAVISPILNLPPPMSQAMRSGLDTLTRKLSPDGEKTYSIAENHAPHPEERRALVTRSNALGAALRGRDHDYSRMKIALLVGMLPSPMTDVDDAEAAVAVYQGALADMPPWAVERACDEALRGKVGQTKGRYRPTPGEMHHAAERHVVMAAREKSEIDRVIVARIAKPRLSEEKRKAIAGEIRQMMSGLAKTKCMEDIHGAAK